MLLSSLSKVGGKGDFAEQIATPHTKCPETLRDFYLLYFKPASTCSWNLRLAMSLKTRKDL